MTVLKTDIATPSTGVKSAEIAGYRMEKSDVERYLEWLRDKGRTNSTLQRYRHSLSLLYDFLPEEKVIRRGTLAEWRNALLEVKYAERTINAYVVVANNFLGYMDHREYQLTGALDFVETHRQELSRHEYLRLLSTAKTFGDETAYMLIKVFACTGIYVNELPYITVENVVAGRFVTTYQNVKRVVRVPECLRTELLAFAARNGIDSDIIFKTASGKPVHRSWVVKKIRSIGEDTRIPEGRANPSALQKLYLSTKSGIMTSLEILVDQAMDRQIEQEQLTVGWGT